MPLLLVGVVFRLIYEVVHLIGTAVGEWVGEGRRRLARAYRQGYALVPEGSAPGDVVEAERLIVSREPISLPSWSEPGEVARVSSLDGVRARRQQRGWWWTATSVRVIETVPYWVVLGPSGDLALQVIGTTLALIPDRAASARSTVDQRTLTLLMHGDDWREVVANQVRMGTQTAVNEVLARDLVPADGEVQTEAELEEAEALFEDRIRDWATAIDVTANAALAAALVDELDAATVRTLSIDWEQLTEEPGGTALKVSTGVRGFIRRFSPLKFADRYPTVAALLTVIVLFAGFFVAPGVALIAWGVLLAVVVVIVVVRRVRRDKPARRGRWLPRGDVSNAVPSATLLRRAMAVDAKVSSRISVWRLTALLGRAEVWVSLEGPQPEDPSRTLQWLSDTGQRAPVAIALSGTTRFAFAFTDSGRHRSARLPDPVQWTARAPLGDLVAFVDRTGADGVVLDPGHPDSIAIPRSLTTTDSIDPPPDVPLDEATL